MSRAPAVFWFALGVLAGCGVALVLGLFGTSAMAPSDDPLAQPPPQAHPEAVTRLRAENTRLSAELAARGPALTAPLPPPEAAPPGEAAAHPIVRAPPSQPRGTPALWLAQLRQAVARGNTRSMQTAAQALIALGQEAVADCMDVLGDASEPDLLRQWALHVLQRVGAEDLEVLVERLLANAPPSALRSLLVNVLAASGEHVVLLQDLALDADEPLADRTAALRGMGRHVPDVAVDLLRDWLERGTEEEREAALQELPRYRTPEALDLVRDVLREEPRPRNTAALLGALATEKGAGWSAAQLIGAPDTPIGGDLRTAWASKRADMGPVWVELTYARAVRPERIRVHETFHPGAVAAIKARRAGGTWLTLWEGRAAPGEAPRWFEPPLQAIGDAVDVVRIELDTNRVGGWNEIDAVELLGDGERQWATSARASSSYAD